MPLRKGKTIVCKICLCELWWIRNARHSPWRMLSCLAQTTLYLKIVMHLDFRTNSWVFSSVLSSMQLALPFLHTHMAVPEISRALHICKLELRRSLEIALLACHCCMQCKMKIFLSSLPCWNSWLRPKNLSVQALLAPVPKNRVQVQQVCPCPHLATTAIQGTPGNAQIRHLTKCRFTLDTKLAEAYSQAYCSVFMTVYRAGYISRYLHSYSTQKNQAFTKSGGWRLKTLYDYPFCSHIHQCATHIFLLKFKPWNLGS